jgi:pimeloyl-ACP methyl ester carboxylesterase
VEEQGEDADGVDDDDDLFDRGGEDEGDAAGGEQSYGPAARALRWFRDELELPGDGDVKAAGSALLRTPIFLGHGVEDDRVSVDLGRDAAACLEHLGAQTVTWSEYEGLGHWYSGHMLQDMVRFLEKNTDMKLS